MPTLRRDFARADIPLFYKNKESFGDIDILTTGFVGPNIRAYIENTFKPNEIFHNGNCWSFDVQELQVDLITCDAEDFDTNLMYLSYNDLGNYIGRIAQGFGLKYGQEGLWYEHYFKNQNIDRIPVSKNYPKIFEFLGLDYNRYEQGFDELEDIFKFIAYSPYFNWKMYQLESLNKINRDRNAKRASYMSFLKWIDENVNDSNHEYPFLPERAAYFKRIDEFFPEAKLTAGVRKIEYEHCKDLHVRSKFSVPELMQKYGFKGKAMNNVMPKFKEFITEFYDGYVDYEGFILNSEESRIYKTFDLYLQNDKSQTREVAEG